MLTSDYDQDLKATLPREGIQIYLFYKCLAPFYSLPKKFQGNKSKRLGFYDSYFERNRNHSTPSVNENDEYSYPNVHDVFIFLERLPKELEFFKFSKTDSNNRYSHNIEIACLQCINDNLISQGQQKTDISEIQSFQKSSINPFKRIEIKLLKNSNKFDFILKNTCEHIKFDHIEPLNVKKSSFHFLNLTECNSKNNSSMKFATILIRNSYDWKNLEPIPDESFVQKIQLLESKSFSYYKEREIDGSYKMNELVHSLSGKKYVVYDKQEQNEKEDSFCIDNKKVKLFCWVPNWSKAIVEKCSYIEIDGTFKILYPYVAFFFIAVINNIGIPICMSCSPTERAISYLFTWNCLIKAGIDERLLKQLEILADMGKAIEKFVLIVELRLHWCHRHLLERLGANGEYADIMNDFLNCKTYQDYISMLNTYVVDIFPKIHKEIESIKDLNDRNVKTQLFSKLKNYIEKDHPKWGMWNRIPKGIARASNHVEGYHSNLNFVSKRKSIYITRFASAIKCVIKRKDTAISDMDCSCKRKYKEIRKNMNDQIKSGIATNEFHNKVCTCGNQEMLSMRYGFQNSNDFPCICNIRRKKWKKCPVTNLLIDIHEEDLINTEELVEMLDDDIMQNEENINDWSFNSKRSHKRNTMIYSKRNVSDFVVTKVSAANDLFNELMKSVNSIDPCYPMKKKIKMIYSYCSKMIRVVDRPMKLVEIAYHKFNIRYLIKNQKNYRRIKICDDMITMEAIESNSIIDKNLLYLKLFEFIAELHKVIAEQKIFNTNPEIQSIFYCIDNGTIKNYTDLKHSINNYIATLKDGKTIRIAYEISFTKVMANSKLSFHKNIQNSAPIDGSDIEYIPNL